MVSSRPDSEWTDEERSKMLALDLYGAGVGPCGHHHAETSDKERFFFEWAKSKCPVCAEAERHARMKAAEEEKWLQQFPDSGPAPSERRPSDGVVWWARRIPEAEARERQKRQQEKQGVTGGNKA